MDAATLEVACEKADIAEIAAVVRIRLKITDFLKHWLCIFKVWALNVILCVCGRVVCKTRL